MTSHRGSNSSRRPVLIVGIGDDGPAGLPSNVLARVQQADLLVGGHRHLEMLPELPAARVAITGGLDDILQQIDAASGDRQVVVLASGDPCFFGIGPLLTARLGREHVEIVPHVSSVALAFARLGLAWQDARVISAHGRPLEVAIRGALGARKLAVLTDETNTPAIVAEALLQAGAEDTLAWVFEHLGGDRETETVSTLGGLSGRRFAALNVLVVPSLSWAAPCQSAAFGLPESAYEHSAGLITKPEVRAVSLSKLRLRAGGSLWDIGAGSGSLTIEAAGMVPNLSVYAVERSAKQILMLRQNVARLSRECRVQIVEGEAPEALAELPDPDAVFVGGSGGRLADMLQVIHARIQSPGRIVANLVTFEHLAETLHWARNRELESEVVQISVARGADILGMTRLQAENPVTIVTIAV